MKKIYLIIPLILSILYGWSLFERKNRLEKFQTYIQAIDSDLIVNNYYNQIIINYKGTKVKLLWTKLVSLNIFVTSYNLTANSFSIKAIPEESVPRVIISKTLEEPIAMGGCSYIITR